MQVLRRDALWQLFHCIAYAAALTSNYTSKMHQLKENLLQGYDRDLPPMENATTPVVVKCTFLLNSVLTFDELSMELTTSSYVSMTWKEPRIQWQPSDENGFTQTLKLPMNKVWSPYLALMNPTEEVESLARAWMKVRYRSDGTAFVFGGGVFKSICSVDVTYYPFDTQECSLNFMAVNYQNNEVALVSATDKIVFADFEENGVWLIDDTKSIVREDQNGLTEYRNTLYLRRKPVFFIVNILLPVVFMALLNIFVFALPPESGERMSYCITVLLAIAVFLTLLGDNIPKTSNPMSFLSYFLIVMLSLSVLICIATIYNLQIFHKEEDKMIPEWLKSVTRKLNGRPCTRHGKKEVCRTQEWMTKRDGIEKSDPDNGINIDMVTAETISCSGLVPRTCTCISNHSVGALEHTEHKASSLSSDRACWNQRTETDLNEFMDCQGNIEKLQHNETEEKEEGHVTWQSVSHMVDKVLAVTSFLIIIVSVLAFTAIVYWNT